MRRVGYLVVAALLCGCANAPPKETQLDGAAIIEAYRQGIGEAIAELRNNSPTIYTTTTLPNPVDPDTNFPYKQFNGPTTPLQMWRLLGHNDFVRGYIGANLGPPVPH